MSDQLRPHSKGDVPGDPLSRLCLSADELSAKIRRARVFSPRTRDGKQLPAQSIEELVKTLSVEAAVPPLGEVEAA